MDSWSYHSLVCINTKPLDSKNNALNRCWAHPTLDPHWVRFSNFAWYALMTIDMLSGIWPISLEVISLYRFPNKHLY